MADRETIKDVLTGFAGNWNKRAGWAEEVLVPWMSAFKTTDNRDFERAAQKLLESTTQETVPTIAQMRMALNIGGKEAVESRGYGLCTGGWAEVARHFRDVRGNPDVEIRAARCSCAAGRARPAWVPLATDLRDTMGNLAETTAVYLNPTMAQRRWPGLPVPAPRAVPQGTSELADGLAQQWTPRAPPQAPQEAAAAARHNEVRKVHWSARAFREPDLNDDDESEEDE